MKYEDIEPYIEPHTMADGIYYPKQTLVLMLVHKDNKTTYRIQVSQFERQDDGSIKAIDDAGDYLDLPKISSWNYVLRVFSLTKVKDIKL